MTEEHWSPAKTMWPYRVAAMVKKQFPTWQLHNVPISLRFCWSLIARSSWVTSVPPSTKFSFFKVHVPNATTEEMVPGDSLLAAAEIVETNRLVADLQVFIIFQGVASNHFNINQHPKGEEWQKILLGLEVNVLILFFFFQSKKYGLRKWSEWFLRKIYHSGSIQ